MPLDVPEQDADVVITDEDRIAYWKGAYDRMAARNIELDARLATLCEPSNPLLAQVLEAFNGAQEDVKNHLFHNSINLFDALTRAKYAMTKPNPMIEAGRERAKRCSSEHCKDGYCMNWHAPHACWVKPEPYVADEHGTPIIALSWCATHVRDRTTPKCPACDIGPMEACRGRVPQDDEAPKVSMNQALADIAAERRRQTEAEGWSPQHDDEHEAGVLAAAGAAYALNAGDQLHPISQGDGGNQSPSFWPFEASWWKPGDPRRDLVKAAALILAEVEKIDRAANATATEVEL